MKTKLGSSKARGAIDPHNHIYPGRFVEDVRQGVSEDGCDRVGQGASGSSRGGSR
jgi:hypothetical protein